MNEYATVLAYHDTLEAADREICELLAAEIDRVIPQARGKVWHGHPVWFIDGNPVVGYSRKKAGVELLFWSGQSFTVTGLKPVGKFQAAGFIITTMPDLDPELLRQWLKQAVAIQWDYANLPKKRQLDKLTDF